MKVQKKKGQPALTISLSFGRFTDVQSSKDQERRILDLKWLHLLFTQALCNTKIG